MQITDVRVKKVSKDGNMKAVASVTLDNEIVIHDIKIIQGERDLFIAMPSKRTAKGEFKDIAHPINSETRSRLQDAIISKYTEIEEEVTEDLSFEQSVQ